MTRLKLFGLILLASLAMTMNASDKPAAAIPAIGVFLDPVKDTGDETVTVTANVIVDGKEVEDTVEARATVNRDGKEYAVFAGMEVYPGDVVSTPKGGGILVAYLNSNVVELGESTRLTFAGDSKSVLDGNTITVNHGQVGVIAKTVLSESLAINLGDTNAPHARMARAGPKPAALEIICKSNGSGGFITTVYCTAGTAVLTPQAGGPVTVADGIAATVSLLTINTPVTGVTGAPVTVTAAKFDKNNKIGALSDIIVKVGKAGVVSFSATLVNSVGDKSTGKTTTVNGIVTKDSWKTASADKKTYSASWSEDKAKGAIKMSQKFVAGIGTIAFSASFIGTSTPKPATLKIGKATYAGTATYDPATGKVTFTGTPKTADGSTATFTFDPLDPAGQKQIVVVTGGAGAGTYTHVSAAGSPPTTTPDGRVINQNQVPKSQ